MKEKKNMGRKFNENELTDFWTKRSFLSAYFGISFEEIF